MEDGISYAVMPAVRPLRESVREVERRVIEEAMRLCGGNKSKAAAALEIDYKTLLKKLKDFGV